LITYSSDDEDYLDALNEVFGLNREPTKTASIGEQTSTQGAGYEVHYTVGTEPYFSKLPADMGIPIYDYQIEPELRAFIYFYLKGDVWEIYVYYADVVEHWQKKKQRNNDLPIGEQKIMPTYVDEEPHEYEDVPVTIYKNNEELVGDFEPIIDLIDSYDALMSDCMNEVDRFANAYMVLKGFSLESTDLQKLKEIRIFENLSPEEAAEFLTKDMPHEYFQFLTDRIRKEIHKQSHVPNFIEDQTGDSLSGVAIDKLLYDFEFIASTKEQMFREGLRRRIKLISTILRKTKGIAGDEDNIDIHMMRNKPQNMKENAEIVNLFKGIVSDETLMKEFIPFVQDPAAEKEKVEEEVDVYGRLDDMEEDRTLDSAG
jgi:SPP1 family phage portal protein